MNTKKGESLIEIIIVMALFAVLIPALLSTLITIRDGRPQQKQRFEAVTLLKEAEEAARMARDWDWSAVSLNGIFHPVLNGTHWSLSNNSEVINGFTRQINVRDVYRNANGDIVASGSGTILDPSTKKVDFSVSWSTPYLSSVTSSTYLTRYVGNDRYFQTTTVHFNSDTLANTQVTSTSGGEVALANNTKAKWCSPSFSPATINLPDGPPVAVAARSNASTSSPNDVLVATSPTNSNSIKLSYVDVTADSDPPVATLRGKFTLNPSEYSNSGLVPVGIGIDNNFKTNNVKYYTSPSGKLYALLAINKPDKEVIAILVNDGNDASNSEYQDFTNRIYKYWTFFNTKIYKGNSSSQPNQDEDPFGYGGLALKVLGNTGYVTSGGYLYAFDLSNIDSKSSSNGLDMIGCRIQLDGYSCQPGSGTDKKYNSGQTGTSWSDTTAPAHNDCSDGGNVELNATNDIDAVQIGANSYVFAAVGAGTNPEFNISNVSSPPTSGNALTGTSCGRISGGASGWKRVSSLDFNPISNTEEAANSVYIKPDGTRAYISSNGGIDANGDGKADSYQFYILNTSNKNAPIFLSTNADGTAKSGFYAGSGANLQLYPRRSLTVLSGLRAVLVGKDGVADGNNAFEYAVLNMDSGEATPAYCGGVNFDQGFNDLTSVIEADADTFVYMVANTPDHQLKIIQGGPDGTYVGSGTIESATFDVSANSAFNRVVSSYSTPANTTLQFQVAVANAVNGSCAGASFNYLGPDGTSATYYPGSGGQIWIGTNGSYTNPGRCFRYKGFLSTTDYNLTPILNDITVNFSP